MRRHALHHPCWAVLPLLATLSITTSTFARGTDGALATIRQPNDGVPVFAKAGGTFNAIAEKATGLKLVAGDRAWPLDPKWRSIQNDQVSASCGVPAQVPPGCYAIESEDGDRNVRSVYVVDSFPEEYVFVHITDVHIGSDRPKPAVETFRKVIGYINDMCEKRSDAKPIPSFVLVTGDITENGDPEQYRVLIDTLNTCALPTFVTPGNHDRRPLQYEAFFDTLWYRFRFGRDGYLVYDTKDFLIADELGEQDGALQVLREEMMAPLPDGSPSRWSVGVSHRGGGGQGMRSQLLLFVDNPLDFLVGGHTHRDSRPGQKVPWGTTPMLVTAAAKNGAVRLVQVGPNGFAPQPTEYAVDLRMSRRRR